MDKDKFKKIVKIASQPIKQDLKRAEKNKDGSYIGKQTRQHNIEDTSVKRNGKYH